MTCPVGVTFDGTNDFMLRGAGLSGAVDTAQGIFSVWFKMNGGNGVTQIFLRNSTAHVNIFRLSTNVLGFNMQNAAGTILFQLLTAGIYVADGAWHHWIITWDTNFAAGLKVAQSYVDGVSDGSVTADAGAAFAVDTTDTNWAVGAIPPGGANKVNADLAEIYYAIGTWADLTVAANLAKWRVNGGAADLGADGSTPTGLQPIVYLRGPASAIPTNLGSGGNFSVTGTLTEAPTPPPCGEIVIAPVPSAGGGGGQRRSRRRVEDRPILYHPPTRRPWEKPDAEPVVAPATPPVVSPPKAAPQPVVVAPLDFSAERRDLAAIRAELEGVQADLDDEADMVDILDAIDNLS